MAGTARARQARGPCRAVGWPVKMAGTARHEILGPPARPARHEPARGPPDTAHGGPARHGAQD